MNNLISTIQLVIIVFLSGFVGLSLGIFLKEGDSEKLISSLLSVAEIAVKSTESQFGTLPGMEKKKIALNKIKNEMQELGTRVGKDLIEDAIEKVVLDMNREEH